MSSTARVWPAPNAARTSAVTAIWIFAGFLIFMPVLGYGGMLLEGVVALLALACVMQLVPGTLQILIHQLPTRAQIDTVLTEQLIVELYSKN